MALKLGELVAYLRVNKQDFDRDLVASQMEFRQAGRGMERDATSTGQALGAALGAGGVAGGDKFTRDASGRIRDSNGRFVKAGEQLGQSLGEGFTRDALGRLRDARGRFVKEGEGLGRGVGDGFQGGTSGWLGQVQSAIRSMGGAFGSAKDWIQQTQKQVSSFAGNVSSVIGGVWSLVQVLAVLAAVAAFAVPAVSLLGGALGAIPALSVGAGAGIGVLVMGFMGLADQFKQTASAGGTVVDKAYQIASAERRVRDANLEVLAATQALSRARETAAERIDDLNRSITGAHLDEEAAVIAVADAEKALADARRTGVADDIRKADLALRQQKNSLDDIRERIGDLEQEQQHNAQTGVEGSDEVRAAYDRQRKAVEGVADAEHALAEARKPAPGGGGAAADIMAIAPAAKAAMDAIKALKPAWDSLRLDVQQRLFAGVAGEIRALSDAWLPTLKSKLGNTADSYNTLFKLFSSSVRKPEFITRIGEGLDAVDRLIDKVGASIAGPFVDAFGRLSAAASPFLDAVGDEVAGLVTDFANWIKSADESGALKDFFTKAGDFFRDVVGMGRDVGAIIGDIMSALFSDPKNANGGATWENFQKTLDDLRAWFDDPENQQTIREWFDKLQAAGQALLWVAGWISDLILWLDRADTRIRQWAGSAGAAIEGFANWAGSQLDRLVSWVSGLPARISAAASGMWDGFWQGFRGALNRVISMWNGLSFLLPAINWGPIKIGGGRVGMPHVPFLADGGIVRATPGGRLVGVAEGGQDEVVAPLDKLAAMLGLGRAGGTTRIVAESDDDLLSLLFRSIRWKVKSDFGGSVDAAFAGV